MINSGELNGMDVKEAIKLMFDEVEPRVGSNRPTTAYVTQSSHANAIGASHSQSTIRMM